MLYASGRGTYVDTNPLANVTILGFQTAPNGVALNGVDLPGASVTHDDAKKVLTITGLEEKTTSGAWSADWVLSWR